MFSAGIEKDQCYEWVNHVKPSERRSPTQEDRERQKRRILIFKHLFLQLFSFTLRQISKNFQM